MVLFGGKRQDRRMLLASIGSIHKEEALEHIRENIMELERRTGAKETDLLFLKALIDNPAMQSLVQAQDKLEASEEKLEPVSTGNTQLAKELASSCRLSRDRNARELATLLTKPHFKALLETHDTVAVANRNGSVWEETAGSQDQLINYDYQDGQAIMETVRLIGLRKKNPNEPLGLTVEQNQDGHLVVARILAGGAIERQGLLKPGDVILEVNGVAVNSPEELVEEISVAKENLTLRVVPTPEPPPPAKTPNCYMRALFDYDPNEDSLIPCKEIGLPFKHGDVLQILNQKDPNWWQARKVTEESTTGLIPSQELEERRKAFVAPEEDFVHKISICGTKISKKKKKIIYQSKMNTEFDKAELVLYEEVTRMPPFKRRTLALIGTSGVGRRTLKNRLINSNPDKFGSTVPLTTRPQRELEENGKSYWFVSPQEMEQNIREHKMLEYGEHNGNIYGTSLDSIREVIYQGKMCVLDCSPAALKILHNSSEFMPYVIFVAAPGMEYLKHLYDVTRSTGASTRSLAFDRQSSIRYSSRRARTLESLASLYEDEDLRRTVEESSCLQRAFEKYIDMVIVNKDFDETFRQVVEALDTLSSGEQWVPVNWVY